MRVDKLVDRLPLLCHTDQRDLVQLAAPCEYLAGLFSFDGTAAPEE